MEARRGQDSQIYGTWNVSTNIARMSLLCQTYYMSRPSNPLFFTVLLINVYLVKPAN